MIISTEEIKKYMPIDLPEGDILINETLYGMIKGYNKLSETEKRKIEKKILNAYRCTHKCILKLKKIQKINEIKKMVEKYPDIAILTSEEIKKVFGVEISSKGLIIAIKKEIDRPINITEKDIEKEIKIVEKIMEKYKDEALNVIKNALSERKEIAEHYRNLIKEYNVDGEVYYDKITGFYLYKSDNYKCVYNGLLYTVYVVKSVYSAETIRGCDLELKWAEERTMSFDIVDKNTVKYGSGRYPTDIREILRIAKKIKCYKCIYEIMPFKYKGGTYYLRSDKNGKVILTREVSKLNTYVFSGESKNAIWYKPLGNTI